MLFDWFLGEQKRVGRGLLRIKNLNFEIDQQCLSLSAAELFDEIWPALLIG